jgi:hypothetical protein
MKKLAFFVEGQTEQIFVKNLLIEIAGLNNITINEIKFSTNTDLLQITARSPKTNLEYYVLIVDCGGDSKVQSAIIDSYAGLVKNGYSKILGLKDVHPKTYSDIPSIQRGVKYGVPTKIPTDILLSVLETEAWFMAEFSHFEKIDSRLTHSAILTNFSHDLLNDDVEKIINPAKRLDEIYSFVGERYTKRKDNVSRTVKSLDFTSLYTTIKNRVPHLKKLIEHVDTFLS